MDWIASLPDRLDAFLATDGRMLSRAKAQKAIDEGRVRVNDAKVKKSAFRLQEGDKVSLEEEDGAAKVDSAIIDPVDQHLQVLYEDAACFVIDKPAGIAVHPGAGMAPGEKTLLNGIAFLFKKWKKPFTVDSVLVHRLDKETTGCLLIAKSSEAHLELQKQFETRTVKKTYLALVAGVPKQPTATVDAPIGRSISNRTQMSVFHAAQTRAAQTTYRIVSAGKSAALLECDLHTGRTHQIRVHLSSIGHPVLGDEGYGTMESQRMAEEAEIRNLCLHAWKLQFMSPADGKVHDVRADVPEQLKRAAERMGIDAKFE